MTLAIDVDGRTRTVVVERHGRDWHVMIDGRPLHVSAAAVDGRWSILIAAAEDDGSQERDGVPGRAARRSYEVTLEALANGQIVRVDGQPVGVQVLDRRARGRRGGGDTAAGAGGPHAIVAPMPGRIVKVLVERGQAVAPRQGVVVVEAMKMENELRAPRAGTVADVKVSEGMTVEARAVLVVLE